MQGRMGRVLGLVVVVSLGLGVSAPVGSVAAPAPDRAPVGDPQVTVTRAPESARDVDLPRPVHGRTAVRLLGDEADEAAALNKMPVARLLGLLRHDPTAWLDTEARLFFKEPVAETAAAEPVAAAAAPLDQTFLLHSKPGSLRTIFLDFDGASASATQWHADNPGTPTTQPAWDPSGNGPAFDNAELTQIQTVWEAVAEDYAPFDVDVTTADPGPTAINRSGPADQVYGSHALITPSDGALDAICGGGCGGVAYVGVFGEATGPGGDGYGYNQPAWVFPQALSDSAKNIAEATSHEVGHNLGLGHDGNASQSYDTGHGAWAPIMGVGYSHPIAQWSKGDYSGANNHQDDLAIIGAALGLRVDESGGSIVEAGTLPTGTAYVTSRTDVDTYLLGTCSGQVNLSATPVASMTNLDLELSLLDGVGTVVASADPASAQVTPSTASGMGATLSPTLASGTYYLQVDGVGNGPWTTGYDDYGSLGAYRTTVAGSCDGAAPSGTPSVPTGVTATPSPSDGSVTVAWSAPASQGDSAVTGYLLTREGAGGSVVVGPGVFEHTWTDLDPATTYSFTVRAVNAQGGGTAALVTATTADFVAPPGAPQNVVGTWNSLGQYALLTFAAPASSGSEPLGGYDIYLDGDYIFSTDTGSTSLGINGLDPGTYALGVAAFSATGSGPRVDVEVVVPDRPANDAFAQRTVLAGVSGTIAGNNLESSAEPGEPTSPYDSSGGGGASLWYSWTAGVSGPVTLTTGSSVSGRDTTLVAYTGTTLGGLAQVAANDDNAGGALARVTFTATAGTTYAIAVDGFRGFAKGVGQFTLSWAGTAPPSATTTALDAEQAGRSAVLTATVSATTGTPTGSVTFRDGATVVGSKTITSGSASLTVPGVATGTHHYTAAYVPATGGFVESASETVDLVMAASATTTTLVASTVGGGVSVTAAVTSPDGVPTGRVDVLEGDTVVGSATLNGAGNAAATITAAPGEHTYTATFVPLDASWLTSDSAAQAVTVPAPPAASRTTITAPKRARPGTRPVVKVKVLRGSAPASGVVVLKYGAKSVTLTLSSGAASFKLPRLRAGTLRLTATYRGNATTKSSSTTWSITVRS